MRYLVNPNKFIWLPTHPYLATIAVNVHHVGLVDLPAPKLRIKRRGLLHAQLASKHLKLEFHNIP